LTIKHKLTADRDFKCSIAILPVALLQDYNGDGMVQQERNGLVMDRAQVQLSPGPPQATSSKLLTYCVLRSTKPPTLSGMGYE